MDCLEERVDELQRELAEAQERIKEHERDIRDLQQWLAELAGDFLDVAGGVPTGNEMSRVA